MNSAMIEMTKHLSHDARFAAAAPAGTAPQGARYSRLLAVAFGTLVIASASTTASAVPMNMDSVSASSLDLSSLFAQETATASLSRKHVAMGAIKGKNPVSLNGDALLYVPAQEGNAASENGFTSVAPTTRLSDVLEKAETMIGVPYSWGGNTPEQGLDCSGFVRYVYQEATGILLPRVSSQISRKGVAITRTNLHPGDLVFFNTTRGTATHVGIYVGENQFIHAPKKGAFVRIESMKSAYWTRRYYGARRVA
ncbi:hypothetical protein ASG35_18325 [Burkholderia sp. Leaf177]|nr:hypothetical protein ASG35_18325 [Burkholderia sp. Leaf177]